MTCSSRGPELSGILTGNGPPRQPRARSRSNARRIVVSKAGANRRSRSGMGSSTDVGTEQSVERLEAFFGQPRQAADEDLPEYASAPSRLSQRAAASEAQPAPAHAAPSHAFRRHSRRRQPVGYQSEGLPSVVVDVGYRPEGLPSEAVDGAAEAQQAAPQAAAAGVAAPGSSPGAGQAASVRQEADAAAAPASHVPWVSPQVQRATSQVPALEAASSQLSHLSRLTSAQLQNLQSAASHLAARLPQWELEVPKLGARKMPQLPSMNLPQLPSMSPPQSPQLPSISPPQLPLLPSLEVGAPDLGALRQRLVHLQQLTAEQWSNLRTAAEQVAPRAQRAVAPALREAAVEASPAQQLGEEQQQQLIQQEGQQQQLIQQEGQPPHALEPGPPAVPATQQQPPPLPPPQQQQLGEAGPQLEAPAAPQEVARSGPSATATSAEVGSGPAVVQLGLAGRLREAIHVASPPVQMPRLGLSEWRTGGLTAWGWGLSALLAAVVLAVARGLLGRRQLAAQQAVRDAEQRARDAQRRERQRRRFQRALLAAEDFEGSSVDSTVFSTISKKRGNPFLRGAPKEGKDGPASGSGQEGTLSASGQGRALSASFRRGSSTSPSTAAAPEAGPDARGATAGGSGAGGAAAAGEWENPFLRGMGPAPSFSMDDEVEERGGWEDGAEEEDGGDSVYDPRSWDEQTRRAWDSFVSSSKVGQGKLWDSKDIDEGLPATHVDLDRE